MVSGAHASAGRPEREAGNISHSTAVRRRGCRVEGADDPQALCGLVRRDRCRQHVVSQPRHERPDPVSWLSCCCTTVSPWSAPTGARATRASRHRCRRPRRTVQRPRPRAEPGDHRRRHPVPRPAAARPPRPRRRPRPPTRSPRTCCACSASPQTRHARSAGDRYPIWATFHDAAPPRKLPFRPDLPDRSHAQRP
jgi:hypothetical protein